MPADYEVALSDSDLRAITLEVMAKQPLLASSPGIKAAFGHRLYARPGGSGGVAASVIFHPHAETGGIKHAFQVGCRRVPSESPWSCSDVELRRYVRLKTQDFEVRVSGDLTLEAVLALVEATRDVARSSSVGGSAAADIVSMIVPDGDRYLVGWNDFEFQNGVGVEARLRKDGDSTVPADWEASVVPPEE